MRKKKQKNKTQTGFSLVEVLVALALLGAFGSALLGGLATTAKSTPIADEKSTAQSLAESQMEYVRTQPYDHENNPPQYSLKPDMDVPEGYDVITVASRLDADDEDEDENDDDGLQHIEITVNHWDKTVTILQGYRTRQ